MPLEFKRATQNRIFQDVVDQIEETILDGKIKAGARLPSERELCDMFGTSRGTLREALRILEQKRLIEIRLGVNGGAYVRESNSELIAQNLAMLVQSGQVSLDHLGEFREGIEGTVAMLAARRASKKDVAVLKKLLGKAQILCSKGTGGWSEFVKVDENIHTEIARLSGNPLYAFVLKSVHDNMHRYYDRFLRAGDREMEENLEDLALMVDAIAKGDERGARDRAVAHVRRFNHYMKMKKRQKYL